MRHIALTVLLCLALSGSAYSDVISLWNFNDDDLLSVDRGSGFMTTDFSSISSTSGTSLNVRDGDPAGQALRLAGTANNGGSLTWMVNTEGFDTITVSFAGIRTSTGFNNNEFMYTLDSGVSWTNFATYDPGTAFTLQAFDLGGIPALNNNPYVGFRIVFWGATSSSGNNRIDNLVVSGEQMSLPPAPVPEPSTIVLTAAGMVCLFLRLRRHQ